MGTMLLYLCCLQILVDAVTLKTALSSEIKSPDATQMLIAKEGLACFEMADAIPRLATLTGLYLDIFFITNIASDSIKSFATVVKICSLPHDC
jgi:hypothetical protein